MTSARRTTAAFALALAVGLPTAALSVPVQAQPAERAKPCVSKAEYGKVKQGMKETKARKILGMTGKLVTKNDDDINQIYLRVRSYKVCTSAGGRAEIGFASVRGGPYKVTRKTVSW